MIFVSIEELIQNDINYSTSYNRMYQEFTKDVKSGTHLHISLVILYIVRTNCSDSYKQKSLTQNLQCFINIVYENLHLSFLMMHVLAYTLLYTYTWIAHMYVFCMRVYGTPCLACGQKRRRIFLSSAKSFPSLNLVYFSYVIPCFDFFLFQVESVSNLPRDRQAISM